MTKTTATKHKADVLIVTVTDIESAAVMAVAKTITTSNAPAIFISDRTYRNLGKIGMSNVYMAISEMGSGGTGGSQENVRKAIEALQPEYVIMVGIAFGIKSDKHKIGDILIARQIVPYELQRLSKEKITLRSDRPHTSSTLISWLTHAGHDWDKRNGEIRQGLVLSGEKLIDYKDFRNELVTIEPEAIGGEMEGAGMYVACQNARVDWILVKAICDWADGNKNDNKDENQEIAAKNAATFVLNALREIPLDHGTTGSDKLPNEINQTSAPTISDLMSRLCDHSKSILAPIRSEVTAGEKLIKIDRSLIVEQLKTALSSTSMIIVSGEGGAGKTAVVKDFFNQISDNIPYYVFKASEFNIPNIAQIFTQYGPFAFADFVDAHKDFIEKYIVVDSAEKLMDIENSEVFQQFLLTLRNAGWKIIFTSRLSYLEDLKYTFLEVYQVVFKPIHVPNITSTELSKVAEENQFSLPENSRLRELLHNLFYLKEYLRVYPQGNPTEEYAEFRNTLWNNQILRTSYQRGNIHRKRGECFIQIARQRATAGSFFVNVDGYDDALHQLEKDEIIKFDSNIQGYFITHDIYEEWALERFIEQSYNAMDSLHNFFQTIGESLSIRRSFRTWLGEKLHSRGDGVYRFVETIIEDSNIGRHWKDETIVATLLSKDTVSIINRFESKMLTTLPDNREQASRKHCVQISIPAQIGESSLLYRMLFLLQTACKEVDQTLMSKFEGEEKLRLPPSSLFTRPKGEGWTAVIGFVHKHKAAIGLQFFNVVLPVLDNWTRYRRTGATTRAAGQIALYYLQELIVKDTASYQSEKTVNKQLVGVIIASSREIKSELTQIFNDVIELNDTEYDGPYRKLIKTALSSIDKSRPICESMPLEVLRLAEFFWRENQETDSHRGIGYRNDLERHFNLPNKQFTNYYASAYQTPLLALLRVEPRATVDFILSFVASAATHYAKSDLDRTDVEEVELYESPTSQPIKQLISTRLWMMYRCGPPSPSLLQSMHMVLEKWLLEIVKEIPAKHAEGWCRYLLQNARSASITAVVASVVHAEPRKLFNIATVLLRSRAVIEFDFGRRNFESGARGIYSMYSGPDRFFRDERIESCNEKHRSKTLADLALSYQLTRTESENEEEVSKKQVTIWEILDNHYAQLNAAEDTPVNKTWRLHLARMDRRTMDISASIQEQKVEFTLTPKLDDDLREFSENKLAAVQHSMRFTELHLWSVARWDGEVSKYEKYQEYETNTKKVIADTRAIWETIGTDSENDDGFSFMRRAVPASTCAVVLRDFSSNLNQDDAEFCKDIILGYSALPIESDYQHQIGDGVSTAIAALPIVVQKFPEEFSFVKKLLLLSMLDSSPINMGEKFYSYAVSAINKIGVNRPNDANDFFISFRILQPLWSSFWDATVMEMRAKREHHISHFQFVQQFLIKHEIQLNEIFGNKIDSALSSATNSLSLEAMVRAMELLPLGTRNPGHKLYACEVASIISHELNRRQRKNEERFNYETRQSFFEKYAQIVLNADMQDIPDYMLPLLSAFDSTRENVDLIKEFINAEIQYERYDAFWVVWELLYPYMVNLCKKGSKESSIVHTYLLAWPYWGVNTKKWSSLREREKVFFGKVANEIGGYPPVLYSLAKLLNEIGSMFVEDGLYWLSTIIEKHPALLEQDLEPYTEYYLENFVRRYVLQHREMIRRNLPTKQAMLQILNFLLERGSSTAYLIREHIL